ncbi:MAG: Na/Pi cotransporter family protein [Bacillota bacterium]|nr:Na/Pi cotransporter family protein [Bacillota bacterium]HOL50691.1 Na/Pi cotransporter family protein [Bacillota bacterium]HOO29382.1 Na/Pi cotransporter family protein [Bacillota bacterium]HPQ02073.1 Na/Pi cotransporter family protein [Bacillota bacterium]HPZ12649.1 Na/Pi cotransporter family protein [Bacillota bacterium]
MERSMIFGIIGGLGLFLYGMNLAGDGLRRAAGDRMRNILEVLTSTPLKGVLVGMLVTAVMQSSSATTVMLVSFVNAGLMTLRQALGVIMGANIGTTITAQLIAFNLADYALPAIGIGFLIHMVARRKVWKSVGQIVLGFGILFLGLSLMSTSVIPLQDSPAFGKAMKTFGTNPVLGVLIGLVTTLVVQSSAATIGMLMALAISSPDLVTLEVAIPILLGDNIGTCITAILSGIGASVTARRTAMAHLMFNVFGALIFLPFIGPFKWVVEAVTRSGDIQRQIANAHTLFNVANTVIWLPATGFLERVVSWLVPGEDTVVEIGPKYLDRRMLGTPPIALDLAVAETVRMGEIVQEMLDYSRKALTQGYTSQLDSDLESREQLIDDLNREVVLYLSMVAQSSLNEAESRRLAGLMHAVGDVERIGDVAEQLMFYAREKFDQGLTFSETAMKELEGVFDLAEQMLARGVVALRDNDMEAVEDVYNIHKKLDETTNMLRANHIGRLNEGKCVPGSGVIFVELMNSLERMGDLSVNLADAVSGKKSPRVEPRS